ncbi:hypothetical protein PU088_000584 [Citrobacter farmeri]|uniref:Uncharacterized protein n=1 Tax=Citrobacter amalonaticus Y19 TaxID=1261127 RepID=A0A0F6RG90_CITAM|nr:hypothetical protein [Citrobacter amalonaticus]AKE60090.1 hypothetical protein F384_16785 [Citrobacter amalonaticus Y19]EKV5653157.1 hypothetical protein [Citrobacter farmeri]
MGKRRTYLVAACILVLIAAATFWLVSHLNHLALVQQQTQHQIAQLRDLSQQHNDDGELQAAVKNINTRTETLTRQLTDACAEQEQKFKSLNEQLSAQENRIQTLSSDYQHLQQQFATRSRATAKAHSPRPRAATAPFSLMGTEFRAGQPFAVIAPPGYHSFAQLQLVAPGDNVQGWQLQQLDGGHATFSKNGQRLTLNSGG